MIRYSFVPARPDYPAASVAYFCSAALSPAGLPAGVIAERLGVLPSSLTFHLNLLHRAGLISQTRRSRQLIYAAEYGAMTELLAYLTENCCGTGTNCAPACSPADAFATGESADAVARA